jgi:hypothetical protein
MSNLSIIKISKVRVVADKLFCIYQNIVINSTDLY